MIILGRETSRLDYTFINHFKDVNCEFDEFWVDTHLCKPRCLYLVYDASEFFHNERGPIVLFQNIIYMCVY